MVPYMDDKKVVAYARTKAREVPHVPGAEREPVPLYLECLFPYFFVDQLTGWRDIKSRMPSYLRIPEMTKRSAEYVLDLDILRRAIERQELLQREQETKARWGKELEGVAAGQRLATTATGGGLARNGSTHLVWWDEETQVLGMTRLGTALLTGLSWGRWRSSFAVKAVGGRGQGRVGRIGP